MIEHFFRYICLWVVRKPKEFQDKLNILARDKIRRIASRREVEVSTNYGFRMFVSPSDYASYGTYFFGDYDQRMSSVISRLIFPGQTVIDMGAERGWFTLLFSSLVGKKGKVISFEPSREIFDKLKTNVSINNFSWAKCENLAISNKLGQSFFVASNDKIFPNIKIIKYCSGLGYITDRKTRMRGHIVETTTLDNYLITNRIKNVDFIKIDIEGSEYNALLGAKRTLAKMKPKLVVEFNRDTASRSGRSMEKAYNFLKRLNYSMFTFESDHFVDLVFRKGKIEYPHDVFDVYCFPKK